MNRVTYELVWVQQGQVKWEEWHVRTKGYARTHIPGMDEHIGFANFDLENHHLQPIEELPNGELRYTCVELGSNELQYASMFQGSMVGDLLAVQGAADIAKQILTYHGFSFRELSSDPIR